METVNNSNVRGSPDMDEMLKPYVKMTKDESMLRKVVCRYGPGCTHILDPTHREKFWHPRIQILNGKSFIIYSQFIS
jgi:hypothetical protein